MARIRGDASHPLSGGFTCAKGRGLGQLHADPGRFRTCRRRTPAGFEEIDAEAAVAEAGADLRQIVEGHGPDAVGLYWGTHGVMTMLSKPFVYGFWRALGSHKFFSTMTIDQAPKWVAPGRIGQWRGGRQRFEESDVWMFAGFNPLVSMLGGIVTGFPQQNGFRRLTAAKRRGLKVIAIDPRWSEIAARADIHLQLIPGTDAILLAGMLHVILRDGLHDREFCRRHVADLDRLRAALAPATPAVVAERTGTEPDMIVAAATCFGSARKGMLSTGTGANMGPQSNLVEHLAWCLNIICGRFAREGDDWYLPNVLSSLDRPELGMPPRAQVIPPSRTWEEGYRSRIRDGYGLLFGELPTVTLPDEILEPGDDRIRALIVVGGNPAASIPGQERTMAAFEQLELLVALEPFPTETAELAHYVLAPALSLERAEHTGPLEYHIGAPFAQYTPAILERPVGVREDWQYLLGLASALGLTVEALGRSFPPGAPLPESEELLELLAADGRVPLADVRRHPSGKLYADLPPVKVLPAESDESRFELLAEDVAAELEECLRPEPVGSALRPFQLVVRRVKETMNSTGRRIEGFSRDPFNPCFVHPADLADLGLDGGDVARVTSDHGDILVVVRSDDTLRPGVISMTHGYGDLPGRHDDDPRCVGTNPNRLTSGDSDLQAINAMPRLTAVRVSLSVP